MDNLNELKAIWRTGHDPRLPQAEDIKQSILTFKRQRVYKKWFVIVVAIFLAIVMMITIVVYPSHQFTTKAGAMLIMLSCLLLAGTNLRSLKRFHQLYACSNAEFISFLEKTRQNQLYYYRKTQAWIILLCGSGLLLYLYEFATKKPGFIVAIYFFLLLYLLIMWFVVRPKMFRKNTEQIIDMQQYFEKLNHQLDNEK
jgi:Flp pilus assembly protein TadB